jgi:hypothetical protein
MVAVRKPVVLRLNGHSIPKLLLQHGDEVRKLKDLVADAVPPEGWDGVWMQYDEIYYLRYILSFKTASKAEPNVRANFEFRKEKDTLEFATMAVQGTFKDHPSVAKHNCFMQAGDLPNGQCNEGSTIAGFGGDYDGLWASVTQEEYVLLPFASFCSPSHTCLGPTLLQPTSAVLSQAATSELQLGCDYNPQSQASFAQPLLPRARVLAQRFCDPEEWRARKAGHSF